MKVEHSWLRTATMRCDLVITIRWWGNAPEHDDLSALRRPCVFLKKVMWFQMIPKFITKRNLTLLHPLGTEKWLLGTAVFIARILTAEIAACNASLLSTCHQVAGKQPAECKGRNSLLVLAKNLRRTHRVFDAGSCVGPQNEIIHLAPR